MRFPLLDIFLSMLWFFLWILWIFLVVRIIMDIFTHRDMGGWAKAGWLVFVIVLPLFGVLVYLIVYGHDMAVRREREAREADQAMRSYIRDAAGVDSSASDLAKLADLREKGLISDTEFQRGKAKLLA